MVPLLMLQPRLPSTAFIAFPVLSMRSWRWHSWWPNVQIPTSLTCVRAGILVLGFIARSHYCLSNIWGSARGGGILAFLGFWPTSPPTSSEKFSSGEK